MLRVRSDAAAGGDGNTWQTAFQDLQLALDAAAPLAETGQDVQVWLAAGTYVPSRQTDPKEPSSITFQLMNRVAIYGGFTGTEKQLSQRNHRTNHSTLSGLEIAWHVVTAWGTDSSAILDGVTVEDGLASFGFPMFSDRGGGLLVINANPTITDCTFQNNRTTLFDSHGGAVYNDGGSPSFLRCSFISNVSDAGDGGAFASDSGNPTFVECDFFDNVASFGGGALKGAGYVADDCNFIGNSSAGGGSIFGAGDFRRCHFQMNNGGPSGGAAYANGDSLFVACSFVENIGMLDGGAISGTGFLNLINCTFLKNLSFGKGSAVIGEGAFTNCVFNSQSPSVAVYLRGMPRLINNTFLNNKGGAVEYAGVGALTVINTLFWNNPRSGISNEAAQITAPSGSVRLEYSYVQGLTGSLGGAGNIGGGATPHPGFVDSFGPDGVLGTLDDDLRPGIGSPCIDAGSNVELPLDMCDLDANGVTTEILPIDAAALLRRVDDFFTSDTGQGKAPVVDIGAYEFQGAEGCPADWNGDKHVDSRDFFDFLIDFFNNDADFNRDGATNPQDFFDYLIFFFTGCP